MNGRACFWIAFCWLAIFFYVPCLPIVGGHSAPCLGDSSLIGVDNVDTDNLQCCDHRGHCYGYNKRKIEAILGPTLLDSLPRADKPQSIPHTTPRFKRAADQLERSSVFEMNPAPLPNETVCCTSNISVFFPISGISATTRERVPVLQIGPLRQPVIYNRCLQKECRLLRGYCTQIYLPQFMYVLAADNKGNLTVERDFILVESGCECQANWQGQSHRISPAVEIDSKVNDELQAFGIDVSFKEVAFLATASKPSSTLSPSSSHEDMVRNSTTELTFSATAENSIEPTLTGPTEQPTEQIIEVSQQHDRPTEEPSEQTTDRPTEETTSDPLHQSVVTETIPMEELTELPLHPGNTPSLELPSPGFPVNLMGHRDPIMEAISKVINF